MLFRSFIISFLLFCACVPKKPFQKGTIISVLDTNIPHLDPIRSTNTPSSIINSSIFEGFYHYHYLKRPLQIEPKLAEAMPEISEKGHVYTIRIKKGVFFRMIRLSPIPGDVSWLLRILFIPGNVLLIQRIRLKVGGCLMD